MLPFVRLLEFFPYLSILEELFLKRLYQFSWHLLQEEFYQKSTSVRTVLSNRVLFVFYHEMSSTHTNFVPIFVASVLLTFSLIILSSTLKWEFLANPTYIGSVDHLESYFEIQAWICLVWENFYAQNLSKGYLENFVLILIGHFVFMGYLYQRMIWCLWLWRLKQVRKASLNLILIGRASMV